MSQQEDLKWLVKSNGRILGPYSLNQINDLVRKKELVLLDEVCKPYQRWFYIRDTEDFADLIEEIRQMELKRVGSEDTQTVGMVTDELTASVTEALDESMDDELTGEVDPIEFDVTKTVDIDQGLDSEIGQEEEEYEVQRFGTESAVQHETKSTNQWGWVVALLVIVGAGTYLSFNNLVEAPKTMEDRFGEHFKNGGTFLRLGEFEKALTHYEKAFDLKPLMEDIHLPLGVLQIQVSRQTVSGKRMLNNVLNYDLKLQKHALTGIGLANLIEGQVRYAEKNFNLALKIDPKFTSASINKGIGYFLQRKYKSARKQFEKVIAAGGGKDKSTPVFLANNHIHAWKATKTDSHLRKAKKILIDFVKNNYDYRQEAFFLLIYISHLENNLDDLQKYAERLLNTDPDLTRRFKHDLYIYSDVIGWANFASWCNEVYSRHRGLEFISAVNALCLVKSGQVKNAESRIVESLNRFPKHALISGLNSYILNAAGRYDESSIALGKANDYNKGRRKYYQPMVLQAWFCQKNRNFDCALETWFKILDIKPSDLQAKVNVARIRSQKGIKMNPKDAARLEKKFGNYIPLRILKDYYASQKI